MDAIAAKTPRSRWHPEVPRLLAAVGDAIPAELRPVVVESFIAARHARCLEPPGDRAALSNISRLWKEVSRRAGQGVSPARYVLGGAVGLAAGLIIGYGTAVSTPAVPTESGVIGAGALFAALGAAAAHYVQGGIGGFANSMLLLVINERRSVVRKGMVTDQVEFWAPKAMMLHRQSEWRRDRKGTTYMWLRLPYRERLQASVHNMIDAVSLPDDAHHMLDAAGKGQRVIDRKLAKNAQDFGHLDDGEPEKKTLEELLPHLAGIGLIIGGIVMVAIVSGG